MVEPIHYPVKRGHVAKTELAAVMEDAFGSVKEDGDWYESSFHLIRSVRAQYDGKTKLIVINDQEKRFDDMEAAQATMKAWNAFLNNATGYTPKERRKKAQDEAKKAEA